jgi:hypothetical protein
LAEAASASQVRLEPVLKFLGLAPTVVTKMRRAAKVSQSTKVPRRRPQSNASRRVGSGESRTWERFLADHRLHHRYAISGQELKMLSQVSFLGQVRTVDDFLSILKLIRKARE